MNSPPARPSRGPAANIALRQFVKFCIVGASNFVLDAGSAYVLTFIFHLDWPIAKTISFLIAVTNSFFWNSRWTFRALDKAKQHQQYLVFVSINIVGWLLNLAIMSVVFRLMTGSWLLGKPDKLHWLIATLIATSIVVAWNFTANKRWTFKA
ncbi:MAG TPA: GtrA family protein [Abditibacteriaceae bacterium]|jgi:putative flippase GtrA